MKLPNVPEIERTILGSLIFDIESRKELLPYLSGNDFTDIANKTIFAACSESYEQFKSISIQTVKNILEKSNKLIEAGGIQYLMTLTDDISVASEIKTTLSILKETRQRREFCNFSTRCTEIALDNKLPIDEVISNIVESLGKSVIEYGNSPIISPSEFSTKGTLAFNRLLKRKRIHTGFQNLDDLIMLSPKEISSIVGLPGVAKSSFKTNLINNLCKAEFGVISIATEQTLEIELIRHIAVLLDEHVVNYTRPLEENNDEITKKFKEQMEYIDKKWNFHVVTDRNMTVSKMRQYIAQIMLKHPIDIIFIDLFDKLTDVNVSDNKANVISVKLGEINKMAEELNVHICVLAQLNRETEKRKDRHPRMSDIKGSASFEEISRVVMGLYREWIYNPDVADDIVEICIIKQNNGPYGPEIKAKMMFDKQSLVMIPMV